MNNPVKTQDGMTLLELLVVLMLVSMLATLLVQGVGYFLGKYEAVQRIQRQISAELIRRYWFVGSVQGMIPYHVKDREFKGDALSFKGVTMQPLASEPGRPVKAMWMIDMEDERPILKYVEGEDIEWEIDELKGQSFSFKYADSKLNWYDEWPQPELDEIKREKIPNIIKLVAENDETLWFVNLPLYPRPVTSFNQK